MVCPVLLVDLNTVQQRLMSIDSLYYAGKHYHQLHPQLTEIIVHQFTLLNIN